MSVPSFCRPHKRAARLKRNVNYSQIATFGGSIATPNPDKLARNRLRYTQFHTSVVLMSELKIQPPGARVALSKQTAPNRDIPLPVNPKSRR